jgi:PPK2 family polyphosphate:nucleotide phosphotransferase
MKVREIFRAAPKLKLREDDAGRRLVGAALHPGNAELGKSELKTLDREQTATLIGRIAHLQQMLYAEHGRKVLLVLQGMDTSGKDGTVRAMFAQINPMGVRAAAFKSPTDTELAHDYLWRVHQQVPGKGEIAIFNRSHYEDVLITLVQGWITPREAQRRYAHIRDFERMLAETGTTIVKVFLHISREEQRERLQARLDDPDKQWKFNLADLEQRKKWDEYQRAYETAIRETDAEHAPWYVVPANSKTHRNLAIAHILLETLESMKLSFPKPTEKLSSIKVD